MDTTDLIKRRAHAAEKKNLVKCLIRLPIVLKFLCVMNVNTVLLLTKKCGKMPLTSYHRILNEVIKTTLIKFDKFITVKCAKILEMASL
jgi:hypothetical protein